MKDIKVIRFGLGQVTCDWGTYGGMPAVFLEPVKEAGEVGKRAPQGPKDSVEDGGTILQFHGSHGAEILLEDIRTALLGEENHGKAE